MPPKLQANWPNAVLYGAGIGVGPMHTPPLGITVHHSADCDLDRVLQETARSRIGYHLIIDRSGALVQTAPLTDRVDHAGIAMWRGHSPNRCYLGVCLISWGRLTKDHRAYTGAAVAPSEVALRPGNLTPELAAWHAATPDQEVALKSLIIDLMAVTQVRPETVCGHDECALPRGRKDDPGGVLSFTMDQLRQRLLG